MRVRRALATVIVGVGMFLVTAEALVRVLQPPPRRNLVRAEEVGGFREVGGVWVWSDGDPEGPRARALQARDCPMADAFRVVVTGSSVLNGVSLPAASTPGVLLQRRLEALAQGRPVCVVNLAVHGFLTLQALAVAEDAVVRLDPHVVVLEVFSSGHVPARAGALVMPVAGEPGDPWLGNPLHVPERVHVVLASHTRLYPLVLAALPDPPSPLGAVPPWIFERTARLDERLRARGGALVLVRPAHLDDAPTTPHEADRAVDQLWRDWATPRGLSVLAFRDLFAGRTTAPLRIDPVHLSAAGSDVVAGALAEAVEPRLRVWLTTRSPDDATAR
jgi:hypothetical protein